MSSDATPKRDIAINVALVRQLVAAQFPQWDHLPVKPVALSGWDNRTFHLGTEMTVRLPSAVGYAPQIAKEYRWLPQLAPLLPLPIPEPLALGAPALGYLWPWSINRWLDGENAARERIVDLPQFGAALAHFLTTLQRLDATGGPAAGPHNAFRGGPLLTYDAETWDAIAALDGTIDTQAAAEVWRTALQAPWHAAPVWIHGDVSEGNLLITHGRLSAVIDFGCMGVGDPACDTVIAWTFLDGESREAFRAGLPLDDATWARGRGWALWKALITMVRRRDTNPGLAAKARHVMDEVLAEHRLVTQPPDA